MAQMLTVIALTAGLAGAYIAVWARNARQRRPDPLHHWRAR
jgi:hypothetical protein